MRRIEQDEIERIIGKRHLAEVSDDIRPDLQSAPIAKGMFLAAAVHEDRIGVVFVAVYSCRQLIIGKSLFFPIGVVHSKK